VADFECPSPNCQLPSFGRAGACMACKEWSGICDQFKAELHEIATYLHKVAEERDCEILSDEMSYLKDRMMSLFVGWKGESLGVYIVRKAMPPEDRWSIEVPSLNMVHHVDRRGFVNSGRPSDRTDDDMINTVFTFAEALRLAREIVGEQEW